MIGLPAGGGGAAPNLAGYEQARAASSWDDARAALDGLPGGRGLNIARSLPLPGRDPICARTPVRSRGAGHPAGLP
jgi:hypothetical protein